MQKIPASNLWYKELWVWIIIIMLSIVVVLSLIFLWVSVHLQNDLVSDDYYQEGQNIIKQFTKEKKAKKLNISAKLIIQDDMQTYQVIMHGDYNNIKSDKLKLQFIHPISKHEDMDIILVKHQNNIYTGKLTRALPALNHWYIRLYDINNLWVIGGKWIQSKGNFVQLEPGLGIYK